MHRVVQSTSNLPYITHEQQVKQHFPENNLKNDRLFKDNNVIMFRDMPLCATLALLLHVGLMLGICRSKQQQQCVCLMVCWEEAGLLLKAERSCCGGVENTVWRGYFHDPISIKEAKLFMWSA